MKVKAIDMGYYGHARIRPGQVFELDQAVIDAKAGELPRWVIPAEGKVEEKELKLPGAKVVKKPAKKGFFGGGDEGGSKPSGDSDVI